MKSLMNKYAIAGGNDMATANAITAGSDMLLMITEQDNIYKS